MASRSIAAWLISVIFYVMFVMQSSVYAGGTSTGNIPINDLGAGSYQSFQGGLYPGGANTPPAAHFAAAMQRANQIVARNTAGSPDPVDGKIVMLSIGMSNTTQEFAVFERQEDLNVNRNARLVIINGAQGGQTAAAIANPAATYWQLVLNRLTAMGLTAQQVQVVWIKEANAQPG